MKKVLKQAVIRAILVVIGLLLVADTMFVLTRSGVNFGVLLPAILGVPMILAGCFMNKLMAVCKRSRAARALAYAVIACYGLFILTFTITTSLILINSSAPADGAEVLIVLGGGIRGTSPTLTLKYRLDAALEYLEDNPQTMVVVSGGQGHDEIVSEASVMYDYLIAHGVSSERVMKEEKSESTAENFAFSMKLIKERMGEDGTIVFVTTGFHVFRAERVAAKMGIETEGIPAKGVWYLALNDYMRESVAIVSYFLMGRI